MPPLSARGREQERNAGGFGVGGAARCEVGCRRRAGERAVQSEARVVHFRQHSRAVEGRRVVEAARHVHSEERQRQRQRHRWT